MTRTFVDIHVLQTVPPSCINRDDNGSPKTAVFGGVTRARVSSQAWKNAVRRDFQSTLDMSDLGERTRVAADRVAAKIQELDASIDAETALELSKAVFAAANIKTDKAEKNSTATKTGYLLFLARKQIERLAELAVAAHSGTALVKKEVKAAILEDRSIDLALFGRMVAEDPELNVDAACQVSHALSVHPAVNEFDFFTAMDDNPIAEETGAGAGMLGTVEFTSATLYRYATVDMTEFESSLGDAEAALRGLVAFTRSFVTSMPTGKQNTFANRTRPGFVLVEVRHDQPTNLVGAFESAIRSDRGVMVAAVERLVEVAKAEDEAYGTAPSAAFFVATDSAVGSHAIDAAATLARRCTMPELLEELRGAVASGRGE